MAGPGDNTRAKPKSGSEADAFKRAVTVCMRAIAGDQLEVAIRVTSSLPVVAERSMYWGNGLYRTPTNPSRITDMRGGHNERGVDAGARTWYFAEGDARNFWTFLAVANPTDTPATVTGPGVLDVAVWRQAASMTVHIVNFTNPMMMKGPLRELIPVGAQQVRVRLPAAARVTGLRLLTAGSEPTWREENGWIALTVPQVVDHEVVAIDLG